VKTLGSAALATAISSAQARSEVTSAIKEQTTAGFGSGTVGGGKALRLCAKSTANEEAFLQQLCAESEKL
jgi:hypothetical protein